MRSRRGFTLIELIMTMIVVGILAVFVMGRLDALSFEQRGMRDKLRAALDYARKSAVAKRRHVRVTVDSGAVSFLYDGNPPESARDFDAANLLVLPTADRDCPAGANNRVCARAGADIGLAAGASPFTFDAQGQASARVELSVAGQGNVVVEVTGYVH